VKIITNPEKNSHAIRLSTYAITQTCCGMYFRDLRGVRGVEDNKDQPNVSLTMEDTANQLRRYMYIYIYTHIHIYIHTYM
jgi:hypothetical protein